jgi:hypothetical protein
MLRRSTARPALLINMVNELLDLARIEARQGKDIKREPSRLGASSRAGGGGAPGAGTTAASRSSCPHADAC